MLTHARRALLRTLTKGIVAVGMAGLMLGSSTTAHATPSARFIYIRGKGTETCPSETEVREAVHVRLGYEPFSILATSTMFIEVTAVKGGFAAKLKLVDAGNDVRGDRVLEVRGNCADLMDALALTISIAIDPMSIVRGAATPPASAEAEITAEAESAAHSPTLDAEAPALQPVTESSSGSDQVAAENADERSSPMAYVSVAPLVSLGSAPALSVGGSFGVDGRLGWLVGGIEGRADLASSAATDGPRRIQGSLLAGTFLAGVREGPFFASGVLLLGRVSATSTGVAEPRDASALLFATGARIGLAVPLADRLEARARAEVLANLTRHTLELGGQEVFEYPAALGSVSVGVAMRFW